METEQKLSKLETAIKNRANERVQEKFRKFKKAIIDACNELTGEHCGEYINIPNWFGKYLLALAKDDGKFPAELWRNEEERVRRELFAVMDEVQKAYAAKAPSETDVQPEDAKEK